MDDKPSLRYYIVDVSENNLRHALEEGKVYSVGRSRDNDIRISDKCLAVSRSHGSFKVIDNKLYYENFSDNTNGTYHCAPLKDGKKKWAAIPHGITVELYQEDCLRLGGKEPKKRFGRIKADICELLIEAIEFSENSDDDGADLPTPPTIY